MNLWLTLVKESKVLTDMKLRVHDLHLFSWFDNLLLSFVDTDWEIIYAPCCEKFILLHAGFLIIADNEVHIWCVISRCYDWVMLGNTVMGEGYVWKKKKKEDYLRRKEKADCFHIRFHTSRRTKISKKCFLFILFPDISRHKLFTESRNVRLWFISAFLLLCWFQPV